MRFQNKVAVITGAANGIGRATARILAGEGAYLVAVDISGPALASLAEEIEAGAAISVPWKLTCWMAGRLNRWWTR